MNHHNADAAMAENDGIWAQSALAGAARAIRYLRPNDPVWEVRALECERFARYLDCPDDSIDKGPLMHTESFPARIEAELVATGTAGDRLRPYLTRVEQLTTHLCLDPIGFRADFERPGCDRIALFVSDFTKSLWAIQVNNDRINYHPPPHLASLLNLAGWPAEGETS